jgi:hypothetical protein
VLSVDLLPRVNAARRRRRRGRCAPFKTSYVSQVRTRAARDAAANAVQPVVDLDRDLIAQQTRALSDLVQAITAARGDATRRPAPDQLAPRLANLTSPPLTDATALHLAEVDDFRWGTQIASEARSCCPTS